MSGVNEPPTAEMLARWMTDYAGQRPEYKSEAEWWARCRLWDSIVFENEARWGRHGWPAILAHRAEIAAKRSAQTAEMRASGRYRFTDDTPEQIAAYNEREAAEAAAARALSTPAPPPLSDEQRLINAMRALVRG
jgi:hypothetical protein